ncbi:MAG: HAMP domain-containing protein [Geodermatophilaceae bacterium]|nr:HAMP domain-containing protein [Geodermatophilaceae bacterium]
MSAWLRGLPTNVRFAAMTSSAFLLLMVLAGVVVYREFGSNLRESIDQRLVDIAAVQANAVEGAVAGTGSDGDLLADLEPDPDGGRQPSDLEAQILARDGTVLQSTEGLDGAAGLVTGGRLVRVAAGVPVFGDAVVREESLRFVGITVADESGRIVVITAPINSLTDAEGALLAIFGPVALAGSVLAGLVGAAISRRGLEPLARMAAEADAIGAYDLSQRLPVPARRDEMRRLGSTLNRMLERLDAAVQRERDFTAEVSHELRTPLAILRAEVELARGAAAEQATLQGLDSALEEIDRLTAVVEDLLLLARADVASAHDHRQVVDLGALASAAVERFDTVAAARGLKLTTEGSATVSGDSRAIERALANLLDNALRHTPAGGKVSILIEPGPGGASLIVRDTGPGVAAQALASLFDRYTRAASRPGAAGLGLSIVAAVAASHGGGVRARNLLAGGLEITVELVGNEGHDET